MWGMGVVQKFDAAATDVYLGYRHFDANVRCTDAVGAAVCTGATSQSVLLAVTNKLATEGIDVIVMGARVQF